MDVVTQRHFKTSKLTNFHGVVVVHVVDGPEPAAKKDITERRRKDVTKNLRRNNEDSGIVESKN